MGSSLIASSALAFALLVAVARSQTVDSDSRTAGLQFALWSWRTEILESKGRLSNLRAVVPDYSEPAGPTAVHVNFDGAQASGQDLSYSKMNSASFKNADLSHTNLDFANVMSANFEGANLRRSHQYWTDFTKARLKGANLDQSYMRSTRMNFVHAQGASFAHVEWHGGKALASHFEYTEFPFAKLISGEWDHCFWDHANLKKVDFFDSFLTGSSFEEADLEEASFRKAWCRAINAKKAKLSHSDFDGTVLDQATFEGARGSDINFQRTLLQHTNFDRAHFTKANFFQTYSYGASFVDFKCEQCILTTAQAEDCDWTNAHLPHAVMAFATISTADAAGANFFAAYMLGLTAKYSRFAGAFFVNADGTASVWDYSILNRASFQFADLTGATLLNVSAVAANFAFASLIGANCSEAVFAGSNFTVTRAAGATFYRAKMGYLEAPLAIFEGANFSLAQLSHGNFYQASFAGATLLGADFTGSDLSFANFAGADLTGAILDKAIVQGAIFSGATMPDGTVNFDGVPVTTIQCIADFFAVKGRCPEIEAVAEKAYCTTTAAVARKSPISLGNQIVGRPTKREWPSAADAAAADAAAAAATAAAANTAVAAAPAFVHPLAGGAADKMSRDELQKAQLSLMHAVNAQPHAQPHARLHREDARRKLFEAREADSWPRWEKPTMDLAEVARAQRERRDFMATRQHEQETPAALRQRAGSDQSRRASTPKRAAAAVDAAEPAPAELHQNAGVRSAFAAWRSQHD